MCLRTKLRHWTSLCLLLTVLGGGTGAAVAVPVGEQPTREQVQAAAAQVRTDPNLAQTRREKTLRWRDKEAPPDLKQDRDDQWLATLVRWVTETARVLMWALGALGVALLLVGLRYWVRARADAALLRLPNLPSHISDLDIRPQSLPDRIGAFAADLWQRGEYRHALSLLYRGTLSRLVHQHAVPIVAASTEGECLALAISRLDATRGAFVAHLVPIWQCAVYGGRLPDSTHMLALCHDFDHHFSLPQAARPAGAAT